MHPTLFRIPILNLPLRTYGLMMVIGFLVGAFFVMKRASREGMNPDRVFNLVFYIFFSGIIGARIFFVLTNLEIYRYNPVGILKVWDGGLVWYGGLITAALFGLLYIKRVRLPVLKLGDIIMLGVALGLVFGRLGCFSAGCCYGKPTNLPWGVVFPDNPENLINPEYRGKVPLHPTQIYHSLNALFLFLVLSWVYRKKSFHGEILFLFIPLYSATRFLLEFLRGDELRGFVEVAGIRLSVSQFVGIPMFLISAWILWILWMRSGKGRKSL